MARKKSHLKIQLEAATREVVNAPEWLRKIYEMNDALEEKRETKG